MIILSETETTGWAAIGPICLASASTLEDVEVIRIVGRVDAKISGTEIVSTSDDPNHFHPEYFGKGYRWHDPMVERMELAYKRAKQTYESAGKMIYNATEGGNLKVFERVTYKDLF